MAIKKKFISGTGRRKTSVARVWLYEGKGEMIVNDKSIKDYFSENKEAALTWVQPFHAIGVAHPTAKFHATIKVLGGGKASQLDAVTLGFARALIVLDPTHKEILRTSGLVTRDSRKKERKKPFLVKARKRPQYSKR